MRGPESWGLRQGIEEMAFGGLGFGVAEQGGYLVVVLGRVFWIENKKTAIGGERKRSISRGGGGAGEGLVGGDEEGIEGEGAVGVGGDFAPRFRFGFQFKESEEGV